MLICLPVGLQALSEPQGGSSESDVELCGPLAELSGPLAELPGPLAELPFPQAELPGPVANASDEEQVDRDG